MIEDFSDYWDFETDCWYQDDVTGELVYVDENGQEWIDDNELFAELEQLC
jgi:hypothetical protein